MRGQTQHMIYDLNALPHDPWKAVVYLSPNFLDSDFSSSPSIQNHVRSARSTTQGVADSYNLRIGGRRRELDED
ncbi:hypothetical protein RJ641_000702 [Dillenia turbinata]|uniref:Uncharacterized protein n=1 Tax=Dillenia turbinata TaxID=194707 RepID=A0AAN8W6U0_9MAGN